MPGTVHRIKFVVRIEAEISVWMCGPLQFNLMLSWIDKLQCHLQRMWQYIFACSTY